MDDTSEMGYLVFLKVLQLQGTGTPRVVVSLYHTIQGMLFHSEIMQTDLRSAQAIAELIYQNELMFFHPLLVELDPQPGDPKCF